MNSALPEAKLLGPLYTERPGQFVVIGQKAQIGPNPFKPKGHADLVVCVFDYKFLFMTGPKLIESGAPKMEGQFLA
jgi:hypothetical protein